ncbi:MAG: KamA family radical SAM protein [Candidatus Rhabdochlamydia sp.]
MLNWRQIQRENFTDIHSVMKFLELDEHHQQKIDQTSRFPLNLPKRLAEKIEKNSLTDPIFLQFIPLLEEKIQTQGFCSDPVGDEDVLRAPRLLHKYEGRALLVCTSHCVMNCRFCFRQHFPYEKRASLFEAELACIRQDASLEEIILSGGDPLSLSDQKLNTLFEQLCLIPHVKKIRIHTRFPLGIPERITPLFLSLLEKSCAQIVFVIHVNHAAELDNEIFAKLKAIQKLGIPVLSQTVLLKGVNDTVSSLKTLFSELTDHGVIPYYLHQLDKVQGGAHFEVAPEKGLDLIEQLKTCLPGYAVPKYVEEISGRLSKTALIPSALTRSTSFQAV